MTGAQLRRARERAKFGQRQFATMLGISPAYLCDLESGKRGGRSQPLLQRAIEVLRAEKAAGRRL